MDLTSLPSYAGVKFETINLNNPPALGQSVWLTGFGCTQLERVGTAVVAGGPAQYLQEAKASLTGVLGSDHVNPNYVSIEATSPHDPIVCPGDSGGPLFALSTVRGHQGVLTIVGVNASVTADTPSSYRSNISALATTDFRNFLASWMMDNPGIAICRTDSEISDANCRT